MDRRAFLKLLAATGSVAACGRSEKTAMNLPSDSNARNRAPVLFLAHGSPLLLDDARWVAELGAWSKAFANPKAIVMLSAHWVDDPITLGATKTVPLVYDFYGFPQKYYAQTYAAPGAPAVAARVRELLAPKEKVRDSDRGLDHGAYVPLVAMYPEANVPVLQVSIPTMEPKRLFEVGRALAPLRDEGVLLVGSGFLTHNMRAIVWEEGSPPPSWASEFDAWSADVLARNDVDALVEYRARAPGVRESLPTHEHFVPVIVAAGAASASHDAAKFPITGFTYGSFTKRSVQWG